MMVFQRVWMVIHGAVPGCWLCGQGKLLSNGRSMNIV